MIASCSTITFCPNRFMSFDLIKLNKSDDGMKGTEIKVLFLFCLLIFLSSLTYGNLVQSKNILDGCMVCLIFFNIFKKCLSFSLEGIYINLM